VLAQLALQGAEGTEADCRAILPEAPPSPAPSRPFPWQVVVVVAAGVGLYAVGRRRHRPAFVWIERR